MTLLQIRDEIIEAFVHVQETSDLRRWLPADSKTVRDNVTDLARSLTKKRGGKWNKPTAAGLIWLIAQLVNKSKQWGADQTELDRSTTKLGQLMDLHYSE